MKSAITSAVSVCLFLVHTAAASTIPIQPGDFLPGATVITFETGSTGLPAVPGVTFVSTSSIAGQWFSSVGAFINAFFDDQVMTNLVSSSFSDTAIEFSPPVQAVGAWLGKIENFLDEYPDTLGIRVFDVLENELAATTTAMPFPERGDDPVFVGYRSDEGIARIEWLGDDQGFFGVDNITFGQAIPEPATGVLCALLAVAGVRRKR